MPPYRSRRTSLPSALSLLTTLFDKLVANPRVHATTQCVVNEAFGERPHLGGLPLALFRSVLKLERRVSHEW
jgi:hypothetical protein